MYTNICTSFTLKRAILLKNRSKHYLWIESWRRNPSARLLSDQDRISKLRPFISHVPRLESRTSAFFLSCKIILQIPILFNVVGMSNKGCPYMDIHIGTSLVGHANYIKKYWNLKYDLTTQKESRCPRLKSRDMGNKWSQFRNPILIR